MCVSEPTLRLIICDCKSQMPDTDIKHWIDGSRRSSKMDVECEMY